MQRRYLIVEVVAEVIEVDVPKASAPKVTVTPPAYTKPGRCPHYLKIRSFYAAAVAAGLDTKANDAMREAFSRFFGFPVWTRSELEGRHWELATRGVELGLLAW